MTGWRVVVGWALLVFALVVSIPAFATEQAPNSELAGYDGASDDVYRYDDATNLKLPSNGAKDAPADTTAIARKYDADVTVAVSRSAARGVSTTSLRPAGDASGQLSAPRGLQAGDEAFHYTQRQFVESIQEHGLRSGSYATPSGNLSPLQAHIELSLPPNTPLRDAVLRVDVAGLRRAGYEIPGVTRVSNVVRGPGGRVYTMPGGGYELNFPYAIPPEFIKVVR